MCKMLRRADPCQQGQLGKKNYLKID
jgi:hypothetical protein